MNTMIHVVPRRKISDEGSLRRHRFALSSWQLAYDFKVLQPCHVWETDRDATSIGCQRRVPFLKDVIEVGIDRCNDDKDVILFTNDDVAIHPILVSECWRHVRLYGAGAIRRVNINVEGGVPMPPLTANPTEFIAASWPDLGRDGIVFTKGWWNRHKDLFPDFLIGVPCWDLCFAILLRVLKGMDLRPYQLKSLYDRVEECDLPDGLLIHEPHDSDWQRFSETPSNAWNSKLFDDFISKYWSSCDLKQVIEKGGWSTRTVIRYSLLYGDASIEGILKKIK